MPDRAVLFIDGSNWYHGLKQAGVADLRRLDYAKISQKLAGPRTWHGTRYYIGQVPQTGNLRLYADQRSFLAHLEATDPRISVHLGRIEERRGRNEAAAELLQYLSGLATRIDTAVFQQLVALGRRHQSAPVLVEKGVDVMLAVDLVVMAQRDELDTAYLLTADGDYTHAAETARSFGKKVFAASAATGAQLGRAVDAFIRLDSAWFTDCY